MSLPCECGAALEKTNPQLFSSENADFRVRVNSDDRAIWKRDCEVEDFCSFCFGMSRAINAFTVSPANASTPAFMSSTVSHVAPEMSTV
jgi:hypothetical protein